MTMESRFEHQKIEKDIYEMWEKSGAFAPAKVKKPGSKPFTIVLPPPNASGKMHMGNVLMIAIEDLMIRWHRMKGDDTLWLPGTDHAGFETQITFERELKKQGKSRFDFDREGLYQQIWDFVQNNKNMIEGQIKQMGASVDWSRYTFTLDPHVVTAVYNTFTKMHKEGLVYRDNYMVNYCPKCGTTFADLEILHNDRIDSLYYVKYEVVSPVGDEPKYVVIATVRPETIMLDTHVAVHPDNPKTKWLLTKKLVNPLNGKEMGVIEDSFVDPEFGTGIVKLTPAHDKNDYEAGKKHGLPVIVGIGMDGKMTKEAGEYAGMSVFTARKTVVEKLNADGKMEKINDKYAHAVTVCYKGGHDIEPMILPNWFVKVDSLKKPALEAVTSGKVKIHPDWRTITYTRWMEDMHDWPISRQVVWGIRMPVWYPIELSDNQSVSGSVGQQVGESVNQQIQITFLNKDKSVISGMVGELIKTYGFDEIKSGLQTLIAPAGAESVVSTECPGDNYLQETDTFDTWFSSGHWPLVTLHYPDSEDFKRFYPTSVLETGWEIIRFWVSRMIMFGIYLTGEVPFTDVYLHGMVRAADGKKMSKSLGNVINPDEYLEKFGVDALRMGLIAGTANGKDFSFPKDRILGYRNFANKIWNMARFSLMMADKDSVTVTSIDEVKERMTKEDQEIIEKLNEAITQTNTFLEKFRFAEASEIIYHFMWDEVAAIYIESIKDPTSPDVDEATLGARREVALTVFHHVFTTSLKLLHPFMPFVTEAVWKELPGTTGMLVTSEYPTS